MPVFITRGAEGIEYSPVRTHLRVADIANKKGRLMGRLLRLTALWQIIRREASLVWLLVRDPTAPWLVKALAIAAVGYLVLPMDLVTDLLPVVGWIDDAIIVTILLKLAYRLLPPDLYAELKRKAEARTGGRTIDAQR
jgi:uncharacterized membrane protein YkvA (DUF1232 family)